MSRSRHPSALRPDLSRSATSPISGDGVLLPDGPVGTETAQLLHGLVHPHHESEETLVNDEDDEETVEILRRKQMPWWKRPSPVWMLVMLPMATIALSATIAPKRICSLGHHPSGNLPGAIEIPTKNPSSICKTDPAIQATVAKLASVMTALMGILSCLTTGWWSSFSDRRGRTTALGISGIGLLLTDANFILVYYFSRSLPGGIWFLLVGPVIEGILGGFVTGVAVIHAYLADVSTPATRSRTFSMILGVLFIGFAAGPTLGGLLIRFTRQTISVFYVATVVHITYVLMIWFLIPDSISPRKIQRAKAQHQEWLAENRRARNGGGISFWVKRLFSFLTPLSVFNAVRISENPLKIRRDWSLVWVALSYSFTVSVMGSVTYKVQYAGAVFGWGPEELGYWLSLVSVARAFHLAVLLPLAIKLFKRKPVTGSSKESEPLLSSPAASTSDAPSRGHGPRSDSPSRLREPHSSSFDLGLARVSMLIEVTAYILMGTTTSPLAFTVFGMLASLGGGFGPAIQSVALELYAQRGGTETGRLFGAMGVMQALSSQIIGPAMYGLVYVNTVASFPRTIFFVSVASGFISFIFLSLVRLPRSKGAGDGEGHRQDESLVDEEVDS
ncbi:major facilitator superfamily domain-containing protein [Rhodocollybia butyracea]|uniref:Major facilitator superfamily domain-containing protein n=1 Tax=Rhodocollybia butyracea TaxID=206335 RepID=A0A9P5PEY0_9AGAR|nr:major facilitator superfamily domain-containing protein [Rhodocollybia butyracea]